MTATWFYILHRPSKCSKRLHLHATGVVGAEPSPYEQTLRALGKRHEQRHLETLRPVVDLGAVPTDERAPRTLEALRRKQQTLYQALFAAEWKVGAQTVWVTGSPDFLLPTPEGWVVRDAKINRSLERHEQIPSQLRLYGALLESLTGSPPARLEVLLGTYELQSVPYTGVAEAMNEVQELLTMAGNMPAYEPVGWSKCAPCLYSDQCWREAEAASDVALLPDVDQQLARTLHEIGCGTFSVLLGEFTPESLADLKRTWGSRQQRVGTRAAASILRQAESYASGTELLMEPPCLPQSADLAMFDVEALPPQLDELDMVFLWGLKVAGDKPCSYHASYVFPGRASDEQAWFSFLELAEAILAKYGDIPFMHYTPYEKTKLNGYIRRYGDMRGVAERVAGNLVDLHPLVRSAICLPVPSLSLKVLEKHVGFVRQVEGSGDWAIAQYIQAVESGSPEQAQELLDAVVKYNEEDLDAMWAVYRWLRDEVQPRFRAGT